MRVYKSLKMQIEENLAKIELDGEFKGIFNIPVNINEEKYKVVINLSTQKGNTISIKIAGKGKTEIWVTVFPYNEDY